MLFITFPSESLFVVLLRIYRGGGTLFFFFFYEKKSPPPLPPNKNLRLPSHVTRILRPYPLHPSLSLCV